MKQVVKIILLNPRKLVLLVLRDNKPEIPFPDYWAEIGGEIETNETPLEAIKREISEEISCKVKNIETLGEFSDIRENCKVFVFKGTISEKLENIKLYEGQKLGLFNFKEISNLKMPPPAKEFIINHKKFIFDD